MQLDPVVTARVDGLGIQQRKDTAILKRQQVDRTILRKLKVQSRPILGLDGDALDIDVNFINAIHGRIRQPEREGPRGRSGIGPAGSAAPQHQKGQHTNDN